MCEGKRSSATHPDVGDPRDSVGGSVTKSSNTSNLPTLVSVV